MHSHARLTYNQVWEMLEAPKGSAAQQFGAVLPQVQSLYKLYQSLAKARAKRGAIDFETIETQMIFNAQGKIERIQPVIRNDAHRVADYRIANQKVDIERTKAPQEYIRRSMAAMSMFSGCFTRPSLFSMMSRNSRVA